MNGFGVALACFLAGGMGFGIGRAWKRPKSSTPQQPEHSTNTAWLERHQRLRDHASLAAKRHQLDESRSEVKQETLQLHLSPHFMFNALSSVQWLWTKGNRSQARMIFSSFVRLWKTHWRDKTNVDHSLEEELQTMEHYVRLEELRLGKPIELTMDCTVGSELSGYVPALILQPVIENAIWHGFTGSTTPSKLDIDIRTSRVVKKSKWVDIIVRDNGAGLRQESSSQNHCASDSVSPNTMSSVGLVVTHERLREHHPDAQFELRPALAPWSTQATFTLPLKSQDLLAQAV